MWGIRTFQRIFITTGGADDNGNMLSSSEIYRPGGGGGDMITNNMCDSRGWHGCVLTKKDTDYNFIVAGGLGI